MIVKTCLESCEIKLLKRFKPSHIIFRVYIPKKTDEIRISYKYTPLCEEKPEEKEALYNAFSKSSGLSPCHKHYIDGVYNMVTLSISTPSGYIGSRHRFANQQEIVFKKGADNVGFSLKDIESGYWDISLNLYAVITHTLNLSFEIFATYEEDKAPYMPLTFKQVRPKKESKEKNKENSSPVSSNGKKFTEDQYTFQRVELHSHSHHSDGTYSPNELLKRAKNKDIRWLAITDHNTYSAFPVKNIPAGIGLIYGVELTTFFGHFLVLGSQKPFVVDWTTVNLENIDKIIDTFKESGFTVGIAHPFSVGAPYCSGCRWLYPLKRLKSIDFIEIWNSNEPFAMDMSEQAIKKWTELLNQGAQISATSGADWHHDKDSRKPATFFVRLSRSSSAQEVLKQVCLGQSYMSAGIQIEWKVNKKHTIGARLSKNGQKDLYIEVQWKEGRPLKTIILESNKGNMFVFTADKEKKNGSFKKVVPYTRDISWIRLSGFDKNKVRILITNPIYFVGEQI